jgi:hypothetical protein
MNNEQESLVRKVLKNEIVQVVGIAASIWFFVTTVILPINNIQYSLASIQLSLAELKTNGTNLDAKILANSNDILVLKERLSRYNIK